MRSLSITDDQLIENIASIHEYYLEKWIKLSCYNALYSFKTRND